MSGKVPQRELAPGQLTIGAFNHASQHIAIAGEALTQWDVVIPQDLQNSAKFKVKKASPASLSLYRGMLFIAMHTTPADGPVRISEFAFIPNQNTSGRAIYDPVWLTSTGGMTFSRPTGNTVVIGLVHEVSATVGVVLLCPNSATLGALTDSMILNSGPFRPTGYNSLSRRYELQWIAGERGKPGINADIQDVLESVRMIADPKFEVLGVNSTSALSTYYVEGGITFTTAGADGDEMILVPHLDANQSSWNLVTWGTDQQTIWECDITTGASVTNAIIWAGLKLTNTEVTATDNDQAFFRYEDDVNSGKWQAIYSIAGVDTATDTGVAGAVSTRVHLKIIISSSRIATFYLNGVLVATSTALTNTTDLIPYIGVAADGAAAAKVLRLHGQAISRVVA